RGDLVIEDGALSFRLTHGLVGGMRLGDVRGGIPRLARDRPELALQAGVTTENGPLRAFLEEGPFSERAKPLVDPFLPAGPARADLKVKLRIAANPETEVELEAEFPEQGLAVRARIGPRGEAKLALKGAVSLAEL